MAHLYEYSSPELLRMLGKRFRDYRMRCNLTQKEVAELTGLNYNTVGGFENGSNKNISVTTLIALLKVVGRIDALDDLMPELPPSPYLLRKEKTAQRIRHKKDE
ncbi:MAG: helix-turn-helix transcriptional regulator [Bacteroidales bacterium]|nr:helix-turn-helix transcriptional regulator [Bacteroidales bacterium]